jgi:hypothetical protein
MEIPRGEEFMRSIREGETGRGATDGRVSMQNTSQS